jgi:hypothetical protein
MRIAPPHISLVRYKIIIHLLLLPLSFITCWVVLFFGPLFLSAKTRGDTRTFFGDIMTYLLEHDELYVGICLGVTLLVNLVYFMYTLNQNFIVGFEFNELNKVVSVERKRGYTNRIYTKEFKYEALKFILEKKQSTLFNKHYLSITLYNMGKKTGTVSTLDVSWLKQEDVMLKLKKKMTEICKAD